MKKVSFGDKTNYRKFMSDQKPVVFRVALVLLASAAVSYWYLDSKEDSSPQPEVVAQADLKDSGHKINTMAQSEVSAVKPHSAVGKTPATQENDKQLELEVVSKQFKAISESYENEVKFPPYSQPISENNLSYLEPNRFNVVDVPVLDGNSTASLSLDKFRFFYPEPVTVTLNTKLAVSNIRFEFYEPTTKEVFASQQTGERSVTVTPDENWPQEIRVKAMVDFEQGSDILLTDFNFFVPAAYLLSAGAPISQGADMVIPLMIDVKQAGIYRVRANLYSNDGKVIAALNSKSRLGQGQESFELKVHNSVLSGTDGHYQLRNWVIEKMSGFPGEKASFGVSEQDAIILEPFDPASLSQEPYTPSPEEQQRLDFLREAATQ